MIWKFTTLKNFDKGAIVLLLLFSVFIQPVTVQSAFLRDVPQSLVQPDGSVFSCFASGDEHYNWLHDAEGYVIVQNEEGWYVYAEKENGNLVPSPYVVNRIDPKDVGLEKNIKPSPKSLRNRFEDRGTISRLDMASSTAPQVGTINNLVIFIRFNNEDEFGEPISDYESVFNSPISGDNSVFNYFQEVSYSQLSIISTFYPEPSFDQVVSYQDDHSRSYYQPYNRFTNPNGYFNNFDSLEREHALLANAIDTVRTQIPSVLDLDNDNDGKVDNVVFIISGAPNGWSSMLWPHQDSLDSAPVYLNSKRVFTYNLLLQVSLDTGVLSHEMFHSLGAPDLYHYPDEPGYINMDPVGPWDLMENNRNPPQHMGSYMKFRYGKWLTDIPTITANGIFTLNPLTSPTNNSYKILSPNSDTEFFIVEYRRRSGTFESSLPGSGLIVYRINTNKDGLGNKDSVDEVYVYRPNGTPDSTGKIYTANFSSDQGRTSINDSTNPASVLSDGSDGGLDISLIGPAENTISFYVSLSCTYHSADYNQPDWSINFSELLRVIQIYNVGEYHCDSEGEDGYNPGAGDQTCVPNKLDYNPQDWSINFSELLRLIQIYNVGQYYCDLEGEDGYAVGADTN